MGDYISLLMVTVDGESVAKLRVHPDGCVSFDGGRLRIPADMLGPGARLVTDPDKFSRGWVPASPDWSPVRRATRAKRDK